jgi:hypothetical protein
MTVAQSGMVQARIAAAPGRHHADAEGGEDVPARDAEQRRDRQHFAVAPGDGEPLARGPGLANSPPRADQAHHPENPGIKPPSASF